VDVDAGATSISACWQHIPESGVYVCSLRGASYISRQPKNDLIVLGRRNNWVFLHRKRERENKATQVGYHQISLSLSLSPLDKVAQRVCLK
jgi:hypothetical protein